MSAPLTDEEMERRENMSQSWWDRARLRQAHAALRAAREETATLRQEVADRDQTIKRCGEARTEDAHALLDLREQAEDDRRLLERCRQIVRWADSVSPGESSTGGLLRDLDARLGGK